jgi:hypothetical protein
LHDKKVYIDKEQAALNMDNEAYQEEKEVCQPNDEE